MLLFGGWLRRIRAGLTGQAPYTLSALSSTAPEVACENENRKDKSTAAGAVSSGNRKFPLQMS
jgi:hypothetical protein